jgi:hypothetical protein
LGFTADFGVEVVEGVDGAFLALADEIEVVRVATGDAHIYISAGVAIFGTGLAVFRALRHEMAL